MSEQQREAVAVVEGFSKGVTASFVARQLGWAYWKTVHVLQQAAGEGQIKQIPSSGGTVYVKND